MVIILSSPGQVSSTFAFLVFYCLFIRWALRELSSSHSPVVPSVKLILTKKSGHFSLARKETFQINGNVRVFHTHCHHSNPPTSCCSFLNGPCVLWVGGCLPQPAHPGATGLLTGSQQKHWCVKQLPGPAHLFRGRKSHCFFLIGMSQQPDWVWLRALLAPRDTQPKPYCPLCCCWALRLSWHKCPRAWRWFCLHGIISALWPRGDYQWLRDNYWQIW